MLRYLLIVGGSLLGLFGAFGIINESAKAISGTGTNTAGGIVIGIGFLLGGGAMLRSGLRRGPGGGRLENPEEIVLRLAKENGGAISAAQVAADSRLSFVEADQELQRLGKLGACEVEDTASGAIQYRFPGLSLPRS